VTTDAELIRNAKVVHSQSAEVLPESEDEVPRSACFCLSG
jgi:hypothetical protein